MLRQRLLLASLSAWLLAVAADASWAAAAPNVDQQILTALRSENPVAADSFQAANQAREAGDHSRAAELFRRVRIMAPRVSYAWSREGYELLALGLRADAIQRMRTAVRLEPSAWNLLGLSTALSTDTDQEPASQSEIEEAISLLREAESKEESPEIARQGCMLALRKQDPEWLEKEAEWYRKLDPASPWPHFFAATYCAMVGDRAGMIAESKQARALGLPESGSRYLDTLPEEKGPSQGPVVRKILVSAFLACLVWGALVHLKRDADLAPPNAEIAPERGSDRARPWILAGLTLLCLVPFTGKAFHIDDPLFVWAARQIRTNPLDPYGFSVNWYLTPLPMSEITKNPPLTSYYLAAVSSVTGMSERPIHFALLLPALGVILGTYWLARKLCRSPALAALCALFTPVFVVSSTSVMSDTLMLALWMLSTVAWVIGVERRSWSLLAASALGIALSALSKYFAIALIPLLGIYTFAVKRRFSRDLAFLLLPMAILLAYHAATSHLYGRGLLGDAAQFATRNRPLPLASLPARLLTGASFTGGCLGLIALFSLAGRRGLGLALAALAAIVAATSVVLWKSGNPIEDVAASPWAVSVQLGLFVAGGVAVLYVAIQALFQERDPGSLLLSLWMLGTYGFASLVNWTTNGRSILPMVPAVGILLARRIEATWGAPAARRLAPILAASAALAIGVGYADFRMADAVRHAAGEIDHRVPAQGVDRRFTGHWGFQYYLESRGWKPLDVQGPVMRPGDILVVPKYNANVWLLSHQVGRTVDSVFVPVGSWIGTMRWDMGAGFYADAYGPLPYAFGKVAPERYDIQVVNPPRAGP